MNFSPELLLIVSVGVVGVLHPIVPDHWVPITLIARQRGWSSRETARAAFTAGIGHVVSTLIIASVIWFAGVAVAAKFGHFIDTAASIALIGRRSEDQQQGRPGRRLVRVAMLRGRSFQLRSHQMGGRFVMIVPMAVHRSAVVPMGMDMRRQHSQ
jgi:hypothetical protein